MSDSDSDAPQAVSLSQSKKTARQQDRDLESFRAGEKKKTKEQNKKRDTWLKEQAVSKPTDLGRGKGGKGKGKERVDEEQRRLEDRMQRAMDEAGGESDESGSEMEGMDLGEEGLGDDDDEDDDEEGEDESAGLGSEHDDEDMGALEDGDDHDELDDEDDAEHMDDDEIDDEDDLTMPLSNYLPDHLFTAAFSKPKPPPPTKRTTATSKSSNPDNKPSQKRKRARPTPKDIVLGSKTIRTLPSTSPIDALTSTSTPGTTAPPKRIDRFLSRALALKRGHEQKTSGKGKNGSGGGKVWERRAANLGVMGSTRRSAGLPAASFVRSGTR